VVIGSGATAVTLVPAMAETARHVTMAQRSPTYMISLGGGDDGAGGREMSPATARLVRARNVLATSLLCQASRRCPDKVGGYLRRQVARQLPPDVPIDPHFTPRYDPWDQRLCVVPDGDLFTALRAGRASVVTGVIGARRPWKMVNNYLTDMPAMRFGRIDDGNVTFARRKA
jgi:cation diffusion facilitator CzcD-associated flavoprotein CzcO